MYLTVGTVLAIAFVLKGWYIEIEFMDPCMLNFLRSYSAPRCRMWYKQGARWQFVSRVNCYGGSPRYPPNEPHNKSRRSSINREAPAKNETPVFLLRECSLYVHRPVGCDKTTLFPDDGDKLDLRNISLYSGLTRFVARCFSINLEAVNSSCP